MSKINRSLYVNGKIFREFMWEGGDKILWCAESVQMAEPWTENSYCRIENGCIVPHHKFVTFVENKSTDDFELFDDNVFINGKHLRYNYNKEKK